MVLHTLLKEWIPTFELKFRSETITEEMVGKLCGKEKWEMVQTLNFKLL